MPARKRITSRRKATRLRKKDFKIELESGIAREVGATIYIGRLVGASTVRELGPVLTALMVTGRAGSGIAAELGAMRVTTIGADDSTAGHIAPGAGAVRRGWGANSHRTTTDWAPGMVAPLPLAP